MGHGGGDPSPVGTPSGPLRKNPDFFDSTPCGRLGRYYISVMQGNGHKVYLVMRDGGDEGHDIQCVCLSQEAADRFVAENADPRYQERGGMFSLFVDVWEGEGDTLAPPVFGR